MDLSTMTSISCAGR